MGTDGGVVALYGFRYQMLRAIERLLELHRCDRGGDWSVEIEHATHDSVDYAEHRAGRVDRVVQVKASRPGAGTSLWAPEMQNILDGLAVAFPTAGQVVVESNRNGGWKNIDKALQDQGSTAQPRRVAWHDTRDLAAVEADVLGQISALRMADGMPSTPEVAEMLACLLEARLWQTATLDAVTQPTGRRELTSRDIESLLAMPDRDLAQTLGQASWCTRWHLPNGRWIARESAFSFLSHHLSVEEMAKHRVSAAVLTGFGGLGKSMCAASYATMNAGQYAMVIWLTAATPERLVADAKELLSHRHGADTVATWDEADTRSALVDWLESTPRSWLLVLDDADHADTIRDWIPARGYGHALITSRDAAWPADHAPSFELDTLTDPEMRALITQRLGSTTITENDLQHLTTLTDRWALAVDMVLAWLGRTNRRLDQLSDYEPHHARERLLEKTDLLPAGYPTPVLHVILDSITALQTDNPDAYRLLQAVVALGATAVPTRLVAGNLANPDAGQDEVFACDDLIVDVRRRSLIQPASLEDVRLGIYRHRVDIHALIADMISALDPIDQDRWLELLRRLSTLVGACSEEQDIPLGLSLAPLIMAVDHAVETGSAADVHYLTLLGNTANLWAATGNYPVAIYRLLRERKTALRIAEETGDPENIFEWFAAVAGASLVAFLTRIDRHEPAIMMAEEVAPELHHFIGQVKPEALARAVDNIVGPMEVVRHDHLKARAAAVIHTLESTGLEAPPSPGRALEQALARDDFVTAVSIVDVVLPSTTRPLDRIELLARRAEALAVTDPGDSDNTLREAMGIAVTHHIDPFRIPSLALNTLHRRIIHILDQPITTDPDLLQTYRGWFDILADLIPQPPRALEQGKLAVARLWRDLIHDWKQHSSAAQELTQRLHDARDSDASPEELIGLHTIAYRTLLLHDRLHFPAAITINNLAYKKHAIVLEIDPRDARVLDQARRKPGSQELTGTRYGVQALINFNGLGLQLCLFPEDPFHDATEPMQVFAMSSGHKLPTHPTGPIEADYLGTLAGMRADPVTRQMYERHTTGLS